MDTEAEYNLNMGQGWLKPAGYVRRMKRVQKDVLFVRRNVSQRGFGSHITVSHHVSHYSTLEQVLNQGLCTTIFRSAAAAARRKLQY